MRIDPSIAESALPYRPRPAAAAFVKPAAADARPAGAATAVTGGGPARTPTIAGDAPPRDVSLPAPPGAPPATAAAHGPAGAAPPQLTLEGLQRAWGQTDSPYDLNGDRIVDVDDLIQLLMTMQGPQAETAPAPVEPAPSMPIAEVQAEWLHPIAPAKADDEPPAAPAAPDDPNAMLTGVRKSWGQTDSPYDVNNDQVVDVDDLISVILNWPSGPAPAPAAAPDQGKAGFTGGPAAASALGSGDAPSPVARSAAKLAAQAAYRLTAPGFAPRALSPELHELLEGLAESSDRRETVQRIHDRFPAGLGVNVLG